MNSFKFGISGLQNKGLKVFLSDSCPKEPQGATPWGASCYWKHVIPYVYHYYQFTSQKTRKHIPPNRETMAPENHRPCLASTFSRPWVILAHRKKTICLVCQQVKPRCILGYRTKFRVKTTSWPLEIGRHVFPLTSFFSPKSTKICPSFPNITKSKIDDSLARFFWCLGGVGWRDIKLTPILQAESSSVPRSHLWAAKCHMMCFCLTRSPDMKLLIGQKKTWHPHFFGKKKRC